MDERIKENLRRLNRYRLLLEENRKIPIEKFAEDPIYQYSAERYLQIAIEICLNIGNRIIALMQFKKALFPPESYEDIVHQLGRLGVFDREYLQRFVEMAKLRCQLVHSYRDLAPEMVFDRVQNDLTDFLVFQDKVVEYLKNENI